MLLAEVHFQDKSARQVIYETLTQSLCNIEAEPIFVCIGSERHLLDCFGPLTGTMLAALSPGLLLCGTLEKPVHAENLLAGLLEARQQHGRRTIVAIDASVGRAEDIGMVRIKKGGLVPGKALAKNLPTVGQLAITGVVDMSRAQLKIKKHRSPGLALVYGMAELLSSAINEWHNNHNIGYRMEDADEEVDDRQRGNRPGSL